MNNKTLANSIFEKGSKLFDKMEVYIVSGTDTSINIYNQEIDSYSIAEAGGISLRGILDGKVGYAYSEQVSEESIDFLINSALDSAKTVTTEDLELFYDGKELPNVNKFESDLANIEEKKKIALVTELESKTRQLSDLIVNTSSCMYQDTVSNRYIANTEGLEVESQSAFGIVYIGKIDKNGDVMHDGMAYTTFYNFDEVNIDTIAKEAVDNTLSKFNPTSVKSDKYTVILKNDAVSDLFASMESVFSAELVQKKLSLLEGKIGELIGSDKLNLINDPLYPKSIVNAPFDAEGVPTKKYHIVENGVLKTYMHNLKTAAKMGVETTGNASRSYKSGMGVSGQSLVIEPGDLDFEQLTEHVGNGIVIEDIQGLHSGLNPISGDFSLPAQGYLIEDGKVTRAVNQITIADNFFDFIKKIEVIGNDVKISLNGTIAPSIIFTDISISGNL